MMSILTTVATIPLLAAAAMAAPEGLNNPTHVIELDALNDSGVEGQIVIQLRGVRYLQLRWDVSGLEPGGVHLAHFHGLGIDEPSCPSLEVDAAGDNDGFIELAEGATRYGGILFNFGNVDPDGDGTVTGEVTYDLNNEDFYLSGTKDDLLPLENAEVVLHGLTLDEETGLGMAPGEADGTAGYKVLLPVACGNIEKRERRDPFEFRTAPGD